MPTSTTPRARGVATSDTTSEVAVVSRWSPAMVSAGGRGAATDDADRVGAPNRTVTNRIVAPLVLSGAINGRSFRAWIEQFLAPALANGDIVIADNLASHKVAGVREAIAARGASLLLLPAHSPDLNLIEQVFAKLKALLRRAELRSRESLWNTIGHSLDRFGPEKCRRYLSHYGYRQIP